MQPAVQSAVQISENPLVANPAIDVSDRPPALDPGAPTPGSAGISASENLQQSPTPAKCEDTVRSSVEKPPSPTDSSKTDFQSPKDAIRDARTYGTHGPRSVTFESSTRFEPFLASDKLSAPQPAPKRVRFHQPLPGGPTDLIVVMWDT